MYRMNRILLYSSMYGNWWLSKVVQCSLQKGPVSELTWNDSFVVRHSSEPSRELTHGVIE